VTLTIKRTNEHEWDYTYLGPDARTVVAELVKRVPRPTLAEEGDYQRLKALHLPTVLNPTGRVPIGHEPDRGRKHDRRPRSPRSLGQLPELSEFSEFRIDRE
jgi:hypothetical protein